MAYEGIQSSLVPLTPRGTEPWERVDLPSMHGTLYASQNCPEHIVETVLGLNTGEKSAAQGLDYVGAGKFGTVVARDEVAYKIHYPDRVVNLYPLSELIANLALSEGLKITESEAAQDEPSFRVKSPDYYAALVPEHVFLRTGPPSRFIIAMSLEPGREATAADLPPSEMRIARYKAAIDACGLDPTAVLPDDVDTDGKPINTLVKPEAGNQKVAFTKLDVMAGRDFAFRDLGIL